jgi:hypothetical protein
MRDRPAVTAARPLSFRAVARRRKPISVDGKLDDWDLARLASYDFFRLFDRGGAAWPGFNFTYDAAAWSKVKDTAVRFYTQWDEEYLYFAFLIQDDQYRGGGKGVDIAGYDALHFCLYPARVQPDMTLGGIAYKEHIGLDQDGQPTFDRCQGYAGNWFIGSGRPEGVKLAIQPTADGAVLEFAVPFRHYAPLEPRAGSQFGLALLYYDTDDGPDGKPVSGQRVAWYYAITNVDMNPARFGNFMLME